MGWRSGIYSLHHQPETCLSCVMARLPNRRELWNRRREGCLGAIRARHRRTTRYPRCRTASWRPWCAGCCRNSGKIRNAKGSSARPNASPRHCVFSRVGYDQTVREAVQGAIFTYDCNEMVIVKDVEFYSQCEHHMLPFFGRVHVGYVPDGKIIGLSKIARIVDVYARRLQVQERMTGQIADGLMDIIKPRGVGVVVEASHFCMMMRGVQKQNSSTLSSAMRGSFQSDARTRMEFMDLIRR